MEQSLLAPEIWTSEKVHWVDRDTVSRPNEMKKLGGVIFSDEGAADPKKLWVAKTRFFDRMLQKIENWKKSFLGVGPHPLPNPPPKIEIDPL